MRVLVLNSGSSSVKYRLFDLADAHLLAGGAAERIGEASGQLIHQGRSSEGGSTEEHVECALPDHATALDRIMLWLDDAGLAGRAIDGVGHRVVHGGEAFRAPTLIDARTIERIRALSPLAPLHNPANLLGIEVTLARLPDVPQVAVFDTAFHHSLPPRAYRYAVPRAWHEEYGVRRYGFHGTSHAHVAKRTAAHLERKLEALNLIVLHLGNGASITAIERGRSIDTSMGLTPLEGLVMGTRCGDLDPAAIFHVARESGASLAELESQLNERSGLTGLCGDADVRDVLHGAQRGDAEAELALDVYSYRIRKYIGAYSAALGHVDAVVFTGGVGENSGEIRARVCAGLERFGLRLDAGRNAADTRGPRSIHSDDSAIALLVIPTNEELEIAEQTASTIREG
jgi:acetate kinase